MDQIAPLILTLTFDERSFAFFEAQRRRFFPPGRNLIPAHLTLFHQLPGDHLDTIERDIEAQALAQRPFSLEVTGLRSLGRGVAYTLSSPELASLRRGLAERWDAWLGPQDRQKHQPHVTVQNKAEPQEAKALLSELTAAFEPFTASGLGLELWWYRGGPWEKARCFSFAATAPPLPDGEGKGASLVIPGPRSGGRDP
jgi:2'-5' RNA ligase